MYAAYKSVFIFVVVTLCVFYALCPLEETNLLDLFLAKHKVENSMSRPGLYTNTGQIVMANQSKKTMGVIPKCVPVLSTKSILRKMAVDRECYIHLSTCDLAVDQDRDQTTNLLQKLQQVQEEPSPLFTYVKYFALVQQR